VDARKNEHRRSSLSSKEAIDFYLLIRAFKESLDFRKSPRLFFPIRKVRTPKNIPKEKESDKESNDAYKDKPFGFLQLLSYHKFLQFRF